MNSIYTYRAAKFIRHLEVIQGKPFVDRDIIIDQLVEEFEDVAKDVEADCANQGSD